MLVQMSGIPGSGKSTLARALGNQLGLIVLDTDVVKSALLGSASVLPRLDARTPRPSQVASASRAPEGTDWEYGTPLATLSTWQQQLVRPPDGWVRLDATRPVEENLAQAVKHLAPTT